MPDGLWLVLIFIGFIIIWVISKVFHYARKSEQQWREVDRSKLREWQDDEW